jgi:hypothetical protein
MRLSLFMLGPMLMKPISAIKTDVFAADAHRRKINSLGDSLADIGSCIDLAALAAQVDCVAPRPVGTQDGRPPFPTDDGENPGAQTDLQPL